MARGDESVKAQLEADVGRIIDARAALADMQEWSWTLARRRWRVEDGERFQEYMHRVELGLIVVHRWMVLLRRVLPRLSIGDVIERDRNQEPAKEHSDSTG